MASWLFIRAACAGRSDVFVTMRFAFRGAQNGYPPFQIPCEHTILMDVLVNCLVVGSHLVSNCLQKAQFVEFKSICSSKVDQDSCPMQRFPPFPCCGPPVVVVGVYNSVLISYGETSLSSSFALVFQQKSQFS